MAHSSIKTLPRFVLIGALGFAIDATILTSLMQLAGWEAWQARIPAFLSAVLSTWTLNRKYTFIGRGFEQRSVEAFAYIAVQVGGAAVNLMIFLLCLLYFPKLSTTPIVPLGIGALAGLCVNYVGTDSQVYGRRRFQTKDGAKCP